MRTNEERLNELLAHLDSLDHIHVDEIPQIDLYMDQVTTFMEKHLGELKRYPEDKVLTKDYDQQLCEKQPASIPGTEKSIPRNISCFWYLSIILKIC